MSIKLYVAYSLFACLFVACREDKADQQWVTTGPAFVDSLPGSCPYLTIDAHGKRVISWVRRRDSLHNVFCFARMPEGGNAFSSVIEVGSTSGIHPHSENLPKIIFKPSGEAIVVWGERSPDAKNPYAGLVYYAQSFDDGVSWTAGKRLVTDTNAVDQRYFDVALTPEGEVAIIWLDSRKPAGAPGAALYMAETVGKTGFLNHRRISGPCCECCRTDLFVDQKGDRHVLYRAILNDSIRDMVHSVSYDKGKTFTAPKKISDDNWVINGCPHTGPAMVESKDGLYFSWYTAGNGTGVFYNRSADNGASFTAREGLSGNTGRHPQMSELPGGATGIVWDESFATTAGQFRSKVGLRILGKGSDIDNRYISNDAVSATYPVMNTLDGIACIAYTSTEAEITKVAFQLLKPQN